MLLQFITYEKSSQYTYLSIKIQLITINPYYKKVQYKLRCLSTAVFLKNYIHKFFLIQAHKSDWRRWRRILDRSCFESSAR